MAFVVVSVFGGFRVQRVQQLRNINFLNSLLIADRSIWLTRRFSNIYPSLRRTIEHSLKKSCVFHESKCILHRFHHRYPFFLATQKHCSSSIFTSSCCHIGMDFAEEKEKYLNLSFEEKRSQYHCKDRYVTLDKIPTWKEQSSNVEPLPSSEYQKNEFLNEKVSIFVGDITAIEIDAIVNAANHLLRGGGGVDGAIHRAAGRSLLTECKTLKGCQTGEAKITGGYKLPAKYVIHTVGPVGEDSKPLEDCYINSLNVAKENGLRSIAFPCISTGVFGYPNGNAAHVALKAVRSFLENNESSIDRVVFCLFLEVDVEIYEALMKVYFPV